ncbi:MAG: SNF2-related protein, partial [Chloroflexales bacterium]
GSEAVELTYKDAGGRPGMVLLYRESEPSLELVSVGRPWSFDGDGRLFRLVSEAHRIRLAHLFDPVLAVHTSLVEPLPHQITAVYETMLSRQPLRFLLADDPGAGKTIMAGLLIKELIARGDLQRCLIVCPGSLAEQWQDELYRRFHLPFEIFDFRFSIADLSSADRYDPQIQNLKSQIWSSPASISWPATRMCSSFFMHPMRVGTSWSAMRRTSSRQPSLAGR